MPGIIGVECGQITPSGTGNQSYTGFTHLPVYIEFTGGIKGTSSETVTRFSTGRMDANTQRADATFRDGSGPLTDKATDRAFIGLDRNTTIQRRLEFSWVSFDNNGGGLYGFTIN